jgi:plasmid stabilization system protein ParE
MNPRVVLRREVPHDIESIVVYLERYSLAASNRFIDAVFPAFDDLAAMPGKGSLKQYRSTRLAGVRSWLVPGFRNHVILYRPVADGIEVLAVTHGSRRIRALLLGRI